REHRPKGEIVLVIGSAERRESDLATVLAALRALVDSGARARMAAQVLAGLTGLGANKLYEALLEEEHGRRAEE
ncbi:MAG TPA: hypothetical protein VGX16_04560, partial [Solirubrobacteraceae bacterium]|nr:hypothetical protein [Solirubrobacteraceae bacterium]